MSPRKDKRATAAPPVEEAPAAEPACVAYYYKTKWGAHEEFLELFVRNHWPLLRAQRDEGRLLDVILEVPRFHGDGRADWDVLVTIIYRDWAAMEEHSDPAIVERLFPDRETYAAEERRRFELLEAHWDVPLDGIPLPEVEVARRTRGRRGR
jgi:hypothetical protein